MAGLAALAPEGPVAGAVRAVFWVVRNTVPLEPDRSTDVEEAFGVAGRAAPGVPLLLPATR